MDPMGGIDGFADTIVIYAIDPADSHVHLLRWIILYLAYFPEVQTEMQTRIEQVRTLPKQRDTNICISLCQ